MFQSTPPARGGDYWPLSWRPAGTCFNPRPPRGGATPACPRRVVGDRVSIHAPRAGGRHATQTTIASQPLFQSTPPARGGDGLGYVAACNLLCFNPRPPRGGATAQTTTELAQAVVSIHAPRAGGRHAIPRQKQFFDLFQSTPPARGGDPEMSPSLSILTCFNPRPPRGGATCGLDYIRHPLHVSIHAPRAGGRLQSHHPMNRTCQFQSTPPARGGDKKTLSSATTDNSFNPRPPRGGATESRRPHEMNAVVSIHAPRAGGRRKVDLKDAFLQVLFQSTPPARGGDLIDVGVFPDQVFQSTPPARGGDTYFLTVWCAADNSKVCANLYFQDNGG